MLRSISRIVACFTLSMAVAACDQEAGYEESVDAASVDSPSVDSSLDGRGAAPAPAPDSGHTIESCTVTCDGATTAYSGTDPVCVCAPLGVGAVVGERSRVMTDLAAVGMTFAEDGTLLLIDQLAALPPEPLAGSCGASCGMVGNNCSISASVPTTCGCNPIRCKAI